MALVGLVDADLARTVDGAVFGRHWNGEQVCVSSRRMIIVDEHYGEFPERYTEGVAALRAGDPADPATTLAPLSSQGAPHVPGRFATRSRARGSRPSGRSGGGARRVR